jgi:hypothetical protein
MRMLVGRPPLPDTIARYSPPHGFSVADLCRRWRVGADKVRGFLRRGELVGVNQAISAQARPQWRITVESVEAFEHRRTSVPPPSGIRIRGWCPVPRVDTAVPRSDPLDNLLQRAAAAARGAARAWLLALLEQGEGIEGRPRGRRVLLMSGR